ncbi:hypothetical protein [Allokutzneria oryzae]|uniref:DUF1049 domain-containing protein n=1 Tax=Allokutzneria oryzae TaxID=1378989 RepID=A0ABV6A5G3_9PSEU
MLRFGLALVLLGFGSVALSQYSDRQFVVLMWAEPMQPVLGFVVGGLGVALVVASFVLGNRDRAQPSAAAPQEQPQQWQPQQQWQQPRPGAPAPQVNQAHQVTQPHPAPQQPRP